jgi:hypothetical protein
MGYAAELRYLAPHPEKRDHFRVLKVGEMTNHAVVGMLVLTIAALTQAHSCYWFVNSIYHCDPSPSAAGSAKCLNCTVPITLGYLRKLWA